MRLLLFVAVPVLIILAVVAGSALRRGDPWRADARQLLARTERLAGSGDVQAALGTLEELEKRGEAATTDRARAAVVRALVAAGRVPEAQQLLARIPWADKSPQVAGELLALDLAIRWSGLQAGGRLVSGKVPAVEARDSDHGGPGGAWADRQQAWRDWQALLTGGVRMAEREGVRVAMPASAGLLALAGWTYGTTAWSEVDRAIAGDPAAQLAAVRLLVEEHDPEAALRCAEELWRTGAAGGDEAWGCLRQWQLRRGLADGRLRLWPFPAVERRLQELAGRFAAAEAVARSALARERELGDIGLRQAVACKVLAVVDVKGEDLSPDPELQMDEAEELPKEWRLALDHNGLDLTCSEPVVVAGEAASLRLRSDYAGPHRIEFWRIEDAAVWTRLLQAPRREDLPEHPVLVRELPAGADSLAVPDLAEGRWVVAVSARACPVVVLRSLRVAATALRVVAGSDGILAWTVRRTDGRGEATPLHLAWELVRDPVRSAGAAWSGATPAWRAGFCEGFLGRPDPAWLGEGDPEGRAAGLEAGRAAAAAEPSFRQEQRATTAADGSLRLELPPALAGRIWRVRVAVDRPGAHEAALAEWGELPAWTVRAVCWADKPLVRPGEMLRFAGIVRERDHEGFRRPERTCAAELQVGTETVWRGALALDGRGMLHGQAQVPAGATEGRVVLLLDGVRHQLARCDRVALPSAVLSVACGDGDSQLAGTPRRLRVRVVDAAGAPLANCAVRIDLSASRHGGGAVPVEKPSPVVTDLAGEATVAIASAEGVEATWLAVLSVERDGRRWGERHAWTTTVFPFPLQAVCETAEIEAGGQLRLRLELPAGAQVRLQAVRGDERIGQPWRLTGGADGSAEALLPTSPAHAGADGLLLLADLPGGGEAARRLPLSILPAPRPGDGEAVACVPAGTRLRTGEEVEVTVGTNAPGRDVLLLAGTGAIVHHAAVRVPGSAARVRCTAGPAWAPEVRLEAVAWLPGSGFTASRSTVVRVLPIDRLLRVTLAPDRAEPRPGETVRVRVAVRDWHDRPLPGVGLVLGAVDSRLYALAEDETPDLWRYFHDFARPWRLRAAETEGVGAVYGLLWRSVVWRWQAPESMPKGGAMRAGSRYCGGGRACRSVAEISFGGGPDPTIAWLAGLVTGPDGTCEAAIQLPSQPGAWRLTARAADASATVLVGEVRTVLRAARELDLHLQAPALVHAGDRIDLPLELANHAAAPIEAALRCAGTERTVALPAKGRRIVPVPWTVPEPPAGAPVRRLGDRLGRVIRLSAAAAAGAVETPAEAEVLVEPDGLPRHRQLQLVADGDGRLLLPEPVPAGSLAHLEVRAWPDIGARRDAELRTWQAGRGARGAMAWLLAPAGAERRSELARRWESLGQEAADQAVRITGLRLGVIGGGIKALPEGALGEWLQARARLAGAGLPAPRGRGVAEATLLGRVARCGTALAEGWGEGPRLWLSVRPAVLLAEDALALAIALDAAVLAGDGDAQRLLAARLVSVPWTDDLAAVLAVELLPAAGPARPVSLAIGGEELATTTGTAWGGLLAAPLDLRATPGAVVAIDLRWVAPVPATEVSRTELVVRVDRGGGFRPLLPEESVQPGERILLTRGGETAREGLDSTLVLASGLRPLAGREETISWQVGWDWRLPEVEADAVRRSLRAWVQEPGGAAAALAAWRAALARAEARPRLGSTTIAPLRVDGGEASWELNGGSGLLVEATVAGELRWPPLRLRGGEEERWVQPPPLRVGAGEVRQPVPPAPDVLEPLAAAPTTPEELGWLLDQPLLYGYLADILAPGAVHDLSDLLAHPACGRPGHWSTAALRRWVDAEPDLDDLDRASAEMLLTDLDALVRGIASSRDDRRQVLEVLPAPQPLPRRESAGLRVWYAAAARRMGSGVPFEEWLWAQDFDPSSTLEPLGYLPNLDGWASFLRRECGLPVRLGPGCFGGEDAPSGGRLGTADLPARGLRLSREADGTLLLLATQGRVRSHVATIDIAWEDVPFDQALRELNERLAIRGQPALVLADDVVASSLTPVTLRGSLAPMKVAEWLARLASLRLAGERFERVPQP